MEFIGGDFQENGNTVSIPPHLAGDFILIIAGNWYSSTVPSIPSGWTTLATHTGQIATNDNLSVRVAYRFATSSSTTSGTWNNADTMLVAIYRGVDTTDPLRNLVFDSSPNLVNIFYKSMMPDDPQNSWHLLSAWHEKNSGTISTRDDFIRRVTNYNDWDSDIIEDTGGAPPVDGLVLLGSSGEYAETADHSSLDISGDIDIRVHCVPDRWTSGEQVLVAKWVQSGDQRSYMLRIRSDGTMRLTLSGDGTNSSTPTFDSDPIPETAVALRATAEVDGTGTVKAKFSYAETPIDEGGFYQQFTVHERTGSITSIFNSTAPVRVGAPVDFGDPFTGVIRKVEILDGISVGGTVVASPDFAAQNYSTTNFLDSAGRSWTVSGNGFQNWGPDRATVSGTVDGWLTIQGELVPLPAEAPSENPVVVDTFTRTASSGWGLSDDSFEWAKKPGTNFSGYSVDGTAGVIDVSSGRQHIRLSPVAHNWDVSIDVNVPDAISGTVIGGLQLGDFPYGQAFELKFTSSDILLNTHQRLDNGLITGTEVEQSSGITPDTGKWYRLRAQLLNDGTSFRAKVWEVGTQEPTAWLIDETGISYFNIFNETHVSVVAARSGSTNTTVKFDNLNGTGTTKEPEPVQIADDFNRTETDRWGTPDTTYDNASWHHFSEGTEDRLRTSGGRGYILAAPLFHPGVYIPRDLGENFDVTWVFGHESALTGSATYLLDFAVRAQVNAERAHGYYVSVHASNGQTNLTAELLKEDIDGGAFFIVSSTDTGVPIAAGTEYAIRMVVSGTSIKVRIWDSANAEPGTWLFDVQDSDITNTGTVSLDIGATSTAAEHEFFVSSVSIDNMVKGDADSITLNETESFAAAFTDTDSTLKFSEQFVSLIADFNFFSDDTITVGESQSISYDVAFWSDTEDVTIDDLGVGGINFADGEEFSFLDAEWYNPEDLEPINIDDTNDDVIDEISIVFNDSLRNPGFEITLRGLLDGANTFSEINMIRRDPRGVYPDQAVRGLADVLVTQNEMVVVDYEAPLNTELHYYLKLTHTSGSFNRGPLLPTPQPYIPTLSAAYVGGTAFMKVIDDPARAVPLAIETMKQFSRKGRISGTYEVLGRRNPVVITDVMGGREGSFTGHCILRFGQRLEEIENAFAPGVTLLLQNHNPRISGFQDMYLKIDSVDFEVLTPMVSHGELENNGDENVVVTFDAKYIEVDRPNPVGVTIIRFDWGVLNDTHNDWQHVLDRYDDWAAVYANPTGPVESSS